jgi:2-octaprenyl-6-methoxyphenol hydroxylase
VHAAQVTSLRPAHDEVAIEIDNGAGSRTHAATRLAVVADGGALRGLTAVKEIDYRQTAVVATVRSELPHRNTAFERFTAHGPLALLPFGEELALVWSESEQGAQELCCCSERDFRAALRGRFGGRLGEFTAVGPRHAFPLALKFARDIALPRVILIGNAAQTLHPVAGQGFNLGLRDAWELAAVVGGSAREAIGSTPMLAEYRKRRRLDRRGGAGFTDFLVRAFSSDVAPLRMARGIGLALLGAVPPAKDFVVRRMMFGARG